MYNTDLPGRAALPSTAKLLRSTVIAVLVAAALLITIILPAEYAIDPTGIGRVLGLTQMGEIKTALAAEAAAVKAAPVSSARPQISQAPAVSQAPAASQAPAVAQLNTTPGAPESATQQHTMTVQLKPGQGTEIKVTMNKGAQVRYEWSTAGGPVNYDTHGDPVNAPRGFYHGYGKGRGVTGDAGILQAAFDGTHGWFWRNRSNSDVTVTLKTSGGYTKIQRVP